MFPLHLVLKQGLKLGKGIRFSISVQVWVEIGVPASEISQRFVVVVVVVCLFVCLCFLIIGDDND